MRQTGGTDRIHQTLLKGLDIARITAPPGTSLPPAGSTLITDLHRAFVQLSASSTRTRKVRVMFDEDNRRRVFQFTLPLDADERLRELSAHYIATFIQNHAVYWGSVRVFLDAEEAFVDQVRRVFNQRFNVVRAYQGDPYSGWISDYLSEYNGVPFEILLWPARSRALSPHIQRFRRSAPVPMSGTFLGLDIGLSSTKMALVRDGEVLAQGVVENRPFPDQSARYDSAFLLKRITDGVRTLLQQAGVDLDEVVAIGCSVAMEVKDNRIATLGGPLLTDMADLYDEQGRLMEAKAVQIKGFASLVSHWLSGKPTSLINDGNVLAFDIARRFGLRNTIVLNVGTSLAGGYVDANGNSEYLAEFPRGVLDLAADAPSDRFTRISGKIRMFVSTIGLSHLLNEAGITTYQGEPVDQLIAGRVANVILASEPDQHMQEATRSALRQVGRNMAHVISDLAHHFDMKHVVVAGGLVASQAGRLILEEAERFLNECYPALFSKLGGRFITFDDPRYLGAVAAGHYAFHQVRRL